MSTRVNIADMTIGQTYTNVFLLKQHTVKNTKNGTAYLDMVIQDKTAELPCKLWTIPESLDVKTLSDSDFIVLQVLVEDYQGNKQGKVQNIRRVKPTDKFDKSELIPLAPEDPEKMYQEIIDTIMSFNNIQLQKLTLKIMQDNKEAFITMPGAKSMHHAVLSGLIYHTLGMLRTAKAICSVYPTVKKELLFTGVIVHDIAKLKEFATGPVGLVTDYTVSGKLLGHIHMGARYVANVCEELNIDEELKILIEHMILSHHGIPEHGSAVTPMFLEAELLHLCDRIDSRVYMYNEAVKDVPEGEFSPKVFGLDNKQIYNFKWDNGTENEDDDDGGLY